MLLSKEANISLAPVNETRTIVVKSHLTKLCENVVLGKLKELSSELLYVEGCKAGFKKDSKTHVNTTHLRRPILDTKRRRDRRTSAL